MWVNSLWKTIWKFLKLFHIQSSNSTHRYLPKTNANIYEHEHKDSYAISPNSIIHNSLKADDSNSNSPVGEWINKMYIYKTIKKEHRASILLTSHWKSHLITMCLCIMDCLISMKIIILT
jgi:hypothetical protein